MKPGPFISLFALLARVDEKTLSVHARALRDAGVLEKGGRGRSAIEVDHVYLAKLLISRMATDRPASAVEAYHRFAGMQQREFPGGRIGNAELTKDHTVLDLITALCDPEYTCSALNDFEITFVGSALVEVRSGEQIWMYADQNELDADAAALALARGDQMAELESMARVANSKNALHGIVESRSFTSAWLEDLKYFVFPEAFRE